MKTTTSLIAIMAIVFSATAITVAAATSNADNGVSVLATSILQDVAKPPQPGEVITPPEPAAAVQDAAATEAPAAVQEPVAEPAEIQEPAPAAVEVLEPVAPLANEAQMMDSVIVDQPYMGQPFVETAMQSSGCAACCVSPCCCPAPVCCPAPPVSTVYCLVDPCGCSHQACISVPACCGDEAPCVTWRKGLLGRQIATVCWQGCGHKVTVVVCRRGKVKVRG